MRAPRPLSRRARFFVRGDPLILREAKPTEESPHTKSALGSLLRGAVTQ